MSLTPNLPNIPPRPAGKDPHGVLIGLERSFSGPLPPPEILQGYEAACPGAAERILRMAEDQGEHRRRLEDRTLEAGIEGMRRSFYEARIGQLCAFLISAFFLGCGTYAVIQGKEIAGGIFGTFGLSSIVASFILGRSRASEEKQEEEETEKSPEAEAPKRKRRRGQGTNLPAKRS
jgi:uncharacterized membrane protein